MVELLWYYRFSLHMHALMPCLQAIVIEDDDSEEAQKPSHGRSQKGAGRSSHADLPEGTAEVFKDVILREFLNFIGHSFYYWKFASDGYEVAEMMLSYIWEDKFPDGPAVQISHESSCVPFQQASACCLVLRMLR